MAWTPERIGRLREMWLAGTPASDIADELGGVTRNAVMGKVHRLGLIGSAAHNAAMKAAPKGCCRPKPVAVVVNPAANPASVAEAVRQEAHPPTASPPPALPEAAMPASPYAAFINARLSSRMPVRKKREEDASMGPVVLSTGTMARIVRDPSLTWSDAESFLRDLTGLDFDRRIRGHVPALVGIATIMSRGDARTILCPRLSEPDVLRMMREMAVNGMVVAGRAPERWLDAETGDARFWEDMLSLEPGSAIDAGHRADAFA